MIDTFGYAVHEARGKLSPYRFQRRSPGEHDLLMEVVCCGICHSDLMMAQDPFGRTQFPLVPGHEIVGRVVETGSGVTRFDVGDLAGVGCIADSCRTCAACRAGDEQHCAERFTLSFGAVDRTGARTHGGYSKHYVVDEHYALRIPDGLDPTRAAPLLCGGITVYTPLERYGIGRGQRVGVLGLGGLGHLAIRLAAALGAAPVVLTSSPGKAGDATRLGATDVVLTSDAGQMRLAAGSLDFILDTVSAPHDPNPYLQLLKVQGTMCLVGLPEKPLQVMPYSLIGGDRSLSGSMIGGIAKTQEMLDFCAARRIGADVETIPIDYVNVAWDRIERSDVRYRFVIDMASFEA